LSGSAFNWRRCRPSWSNAQRVRSLRASVAIPRPRAKGGDNVGKLTRLPLPTEEEYLAQVGIADAIGDHEVEHASAASLGLVEADDSRSIRRGKRIDPASCRGVLAYLIRNVEVVDPKRSQNESLGRKRRLGIRDGLPNDVRVETDLGQCSGMSLELLWPVLPTQLIAASASVRGLSPESNRATLTSRDDAHTAHAGKMHRARRPSSRLITAMNFCQCGAATDGYSQPSSYRGAKPTAVSPASR